ncbi:hypothetical protein BST81_23845 [Leptolyngbya sp. 'hensonii']|uniref:WGR domain-containing protein n=1 Tax=Leptolyngbya sp. 'hensonii' TaxID=1922337 RepID=UPI000950090D|nr:WGR domain-containing protein [Leptolyngbya sp. 'hensonii']OLP15862.1 hypothetical protein BST81_23845 [Leptolyngbya sp. 'hensonii']
MQLLRRITLLYQEGRSDKVYEVDLCQVAPDRYVVNFRYGRRGSTLREGVETADPLSLAAAERAFDKLVASKVKKGYQHVSAGLEPAPPPSPLPPAEVPADPDARRQRILTRLAAATEDKRWPLSRVIWRAGELQITAAAPLLLRLLGQGDALQDYCLVWALGRCGDRTVIPTLERLLEARHIPDMVRRIALEALFKLANEEQRTRLQSFVISKLPPELQAVETPSFLQTLDAYLNQSNKANWEVLYTLYCLDFPPVRSVLLSRLQTLPLLPGYFRPLRHLFKAAEYRQDGEVYGLLAYRFEQEDAYYRDDSYYIRLPDNTYLQRYEYTYDSVNHRYARKDTQQIKAEQSSPTSRLAYSQKTREYLLRRTWRTLRRLGELGDAIGYTTLATGVLLALSDTDAEPVRQTVRTQYDWQSRQNIPIASADWDAFAGFITFNHILYEHSPRYRLKPGGRAWSCKSPYKPGHPVPPEREEAFPNLWEQHPAPLVQLLLESHCRPVHEFAVKALRSCRSYCAELTLEIINQLLNRSYEATARLGFELAADRYDPTQPDPELLLAIASCILPEARATAHQWIEQNRQGLLENSALIAALITNPQGDTRQFARQLLSAAPIRDWIAEATVGRSIARLLTLAPEQVAVARDAGETLLLRFAPQLRTIGLGIVRDLLLHPLPEVQELGARILLNHQTPAADLPSGLIDALIQSPHESIRGLGVQLLGQLPDQILISQEQLLLTFLIHEQPEIRSGIRPVLSRLGSTYPEFGLNLVTLAIDLLTRPEPHAGVHQDVLTLLQEDLTGWMATATEAMVRTLLGAESAIAQELAGTLLAVKGSTWAETWSTPEIVQLTHQEVLAVRAAAREMLMHLLPRLRQDPLEMAAALRVLESKWEDSREFGFRLFGTFFQAEDFTPTILISLCDSTLPEVRKFGRDLVSRCFRSADGPEYLLKFSEHPSTDMQLFATNYLESYAVDHPEYLEALQPYFIRTLSQVNRGRVAKQRIFNFLEREALKNRFSAEIVAAILNRQSGTIAITDRARAIELMVKIHRAYPEIPLAIRVQPLSTRNQSSRIEP